MGQFHVFLLCAACGISGGVLYDLLFCLRYPLNKKWISVATDCLFCLLFAILFLGLSLSVGMGDLRFYMVFGCAIGFFLYLKSLHKIVAFFAERVYNKVGKQIKRMKDRRKICHAKATSRKIRRKELR